MISTFRSQPRLAPIPALLTKMATAPSFCSVSSQSEVQSSSFVTSALDEEVAKLDVNSAQSVKTLRLFSHQFQRCKNIDSLETCILLSTSECQPIQQIAPDKNDVFLAKVLLKIGFCFTADLLVDIGEGHLSSLLQEEIRKLSSKSLGTARDNCHIS